MKILEHRTVDFAPDTHVTFIRVETEDLSVTIKDIITVLSNLSWISKFDNEYVRSSFEVRAKDTAEYLARNLKLNKDDSVTSNTGEYVVSELAREAIVQKLGYLDIPLAELFKEQVVGNPGFDYYSANSEDIIIFGEAKYLSDQNAYGSGMNQVAKFIRTKQDISDLNDIDKFFDVKSLNAANNGEKAYSVAFSAKSTSSDIRSQFHLYNYCKVPYCRLRHHMAFHNVHICVFRYLFHNNNNGQICRNLPVTIYRISRIPNTGNLLQELDRHF